MQIVFWPRYCFFKIGVDFSDWSGYTVYTMKSEVTAFIRSQLATNYAWATRGLVKIYTLQTADEQASDTTSHNNGVGFNGCDANILSSFAKQINNGRNLSAKQMAIVYKKMPRYYRQILQFIPEDKLAELEKKVMSSQPQPQQ